jgi:uncharacterized membrane protein YgcG
MTDITEYCEYCKNFFLKDYIGLTDIYKGEFTIESGAFVSPSFTLKPNQYFRIVNSDLNNGVYCNTAESLALLQDETFTGQVWLMAVPRSFVQLCDDIAAWRTKYEAVDSLAMSPYSSESFGGYSYSKSGGSSGSGGGGADWRTAFRVRLNMWRKI